MRAMRVVMMLAVFGSGPPALTALRAQVAAAAMHPGRERMATLLQTEMRAMSIPGLQIAVVCHGAIVFLGEYGVANIEYSMPVTRHTLFPIASGTIALDSVAMPRATAIGIVGREAIVRHSAEMYRARDGRLRRARHDPATAGADSGLIYVSAEEVADGLIARSAGVPPRDATVIVLTNLQGYDSAELARRVALLWIVDPLAR